MTTQLIPVPFRDTTLYVVDHEGQPHVPMKPVVEGMGLDWKSQHDKLKSNQKRFCMVEIAIQMPNDDQRRNTCCMPLRKFPGWLTTVHANKVKNSARSTIVAYQNESDEVLWQHWTNHQAPGQQPAPPLRPTDSIDALIHQHQVIGHVLTKIKEQESVLATTQEAVSRIDERLEAIEAGHDTETRFKVQVYEELMRVDPTSGVRVWRLRMRERMRQIGMTQTRLAVMLGLSQSSVNHYIHDNRRPTLETLERIALSLGLTLAELLSPRFDTDAELDLGGAL